MEKQKKQLLVAAPGGKSYLVPFILITSLFLLWGLLVFYQVGAQNRKIAFEKTTS